MSISDLLCSHKKDEKKTTIESTVLNDRILLLSDLFFSALDATAIETKLHCSVVSARKEPNKFKVPIGALCLYLSEKMDIAKIWKLIIHESPSK